MPLQVSDKNHRCTDPDQAVLVGRFISTRLPLSCNERHFFYHNVCRFNGRESTASCPIDQPGTIIVLYLLLLLIGLPLIEVYFLIEVGSEIGALPTIALAILTAVIGTWLVRHQGFGLLARVREMADRGEVPALEVLDGALLLVAGLFLLLPGFLTDAVGFLLLIPPLRRWVVGRYVRVIPVRRHAAADPRDPPRIIEGDYRRDDEPR
jgi:UPF0716 protein FxsA